MCSALLLHASLSLATDFPYTERTQNYSGWNSAVRGDLNTVGMAGATVGVPDSISAAHINPAGVAMMTASVSAQIIGNRISDQQIQKSGDSYDSGQWGFAVSPPPWGFALARFSPSTERGRYRSPLTNREVDTEVSVQSIRLNIARSFFNSRLAIGGDLGLQTARRRIGGQSFNTTKPETQLGVLLQIPKQFFIGLSFSPGVRNERSGDGGPTADLPGFDQDLISPQQWVGGVGWRPNRFFKAGASLGWIRSIPNAALLGNQNQSVGASSTLQPRLGASYVLAEFNKLKIELAMGTYYEVSRVQNESNRLHSTLGFEVNPWFMNFGVGYDIAIGYQNIMVAFGLDLVRTARALKIIPPDNTPSYNGVLPPIHRLNPEGLPSGIAPEVKRKNPPADLGDVQKIITDIPDRIMEQTGFSKQKPKKKRK